MASTNTKIRNVTLPGDGIGREIIPPAVHILDSATSSLGGSVLEVEERLDMGAQYYRQSGEDISKAAFEAARCADAILARHSLSGRDGNFAPSEAARGLWALCGGAAGQSFSSYASKTAR